jgi:hypothetical protein
LNAEDADSEGNGPEPFGRLVMRLLRLSVVVAAVTLVLGTPTSAQQWAPEGTKVIVTNAAAVFIVPDASRIPLRVLDKDLVLDLIDTVGEWSHVAFYDSQWGRRQAYVLSKNVQLIRAQTAPPVPKPQVPMAGASLVATAIPATPPQARPPSATLASPPPTALAAKTPTVPDAPEPDRPTPSKRSSKPKEVRIRGYVTNLVSPTTFEIEDYRVTNEAGFTLDLENASPDLQFRPEDIRIGVELEIKGTFYEDTSELKAKSIKVDLEQFKKQKQTAVLSRPPAGVLRSGDGWTGTFFVDGQRIQVTPQTEIVFQLTQREKKLAKNASAKSTAQTEPDFRPLQSLEEVSTGMVMTYEGARSIQDGTVIADRVEFAHHDIDSGEKKLLESLKTEAIPFNSTDLRPGEVKIKGVGKFKTVPDEVVQEYVASIGRRLLPEYQRQLADTDVTRIPFQFFVVNEKQPNAFALPNGVVVIHSGLFGVVENEAQFAAIVGHEMAHAIQEHTWRQRQYHKNARAALQIGAAVAAAYGQRGLRDLALMTEGAIRNGYARNLENQADRLGMEYMVSAGYDPREAPRVWKAMTKKMGDAPTDLFWSNHDNNATRRSYLMNELKNNYVGLDYSTLHVNEDSFRSIAERVRSATEAKRRIKVK